MNLTVPILILNLNKIISNFKNNIGNYIEIFKQNINDYILISLEK